MWMPLLHRDSLAAHDRFGALGLRQKRVDFPAGIELAGAVDKVRAKDAEGIAVITTGDRFDFGIGHEGYYGKE